MQSWTVYSQQNTQDSTKEVGVQKWRLWRIVRDLHELKESRKVIKLQDEKLQRADSLIEVGESLIKNQQDINNKQNERVEILIVENNTLLKEIQQFKKEFRIKVAKLVIVIIAEAVIIVLLL